MTLSGESSIVLRQAVVSDCKILSYWDTKKHKQECDPAGGWDWENELKRNPSWREQYIAELDGQAIAFVQIIDPYLEETGYWEGVSPGKRAIDIWVGEEENMNKGFGTRIMNIAIDICFLNPQVSSILIDPLKSNLLAQKFFGRLGFKFLEEREMDSMPSYIMELRLSDYNKNK